MVTVTVHYSLWAKCTRLWPLKRVLAYLEMFLEIGNARVPKKASLILQKNGTEKIFANQWLSVSPNKMISFKFYAQTPFFSTFITLHLGKGHTQTVNRHSGPDGVCYDQFI